MVSLEDRRTPWDLDLFCQGTVKLCGHEFFRLTPPYHGIFVRFNPRRHGAAKMCLSDEGCEL